VYLNVAKRFGAAPFASSNNARDPSQTASVLIVVAVSVPECRSKDRWRATRTASEPVVAIVFSQNCRSEDRWLTTAVAIHRNAARKINGAL